MNMRLLSMVDAGAKARAADLLALIGALRRKVNAPCSLQGRAIAYGCRLAGYLPPCGGRLPRTRSGVGSRHSKSAIADFGGHIGQIGNIRLGMRAGREGCPGSADRTVTPSPSLPHKGGGSSLPLPRSQLQ